MIATVHILGTSSAVPTSSRFPSAQLLDFGGELMLVDCGEGCQLQMRRQNISFGKLRYIFISHAHGDHFFGLIGLLSSLSVLKADKPLDIFAPASVIDVMNYQMERLGYSLRMPIHWHELKEGFSGVLWETPKAIVEAFPLHHSVPVHGFSFREKLIEKNIDPDKIKLYDLSVAEIVSAKKGRDVERENGETLSNAELTLPQHRPLKYAYCTDTTRVPKHPSVEGAHVMYHEATFLEKDRSNSDRTRHSTAQDAAYSAQDNSVDHLLIGHYSARYRRAEPLVNEARSIFPNTTMAREGMRIRIDSKRNTVQILPHK